MVGMRADRLSGIVRTMLAAAVVAVVCLAVSGCAGGDASAPTRPEPPAASAPAPVLGWSMLSLVDGTTVFGRVEAEADGFVVVGSPCYYAGEDTAQGSVLRSFATQLHAPEPALFVARGAVTCIEPLAERSPAASALDTAYPSPVSHREPTRGSRVAVFLRSGEVYFGTLDSLSQDVSLRDAHVLRFVEPGASDLAAITDLSQLELTPRSASTPGTTGELRVPASAVLHVQTLTSDSPVARALGGE